MSVLAVPGYEGLTNNERYAFESMCARHGWNADAIATVISSESRWLPYAGAYAWSPKRTASGLIQFIESTARSLGVQPTLEKPSLVTSTSGDGKLWATWRVLAMPIVEQLPLVERFYLNAFGTSVPTNLWDYYTVPWGAGWGLSTSTVLAPRGSSVYEGNKGLDYNGDGQITVGDLDAHLRKIQGYASGKRIASVAFIADKSIPANNNGTILLGALATAAVVASLARKKSRQNGNAKKKS